MTIAKNSAILTFLPPPPRKFVRGPRPSRQRKNRLLRAWKHSGSGLSLKVWARTHEGQRDDVGGLCTEWLRTKGQR